MNIVVFETSSETVSVAVARGDRVVSREFADAGQQSSELALPALHTLLAELDLTVKDLDLIGFGRGPGSFTGVRIACGLAQGLAYGLGKRVVGLPSTLALAEASDTAGPEQILVALDARMGEVYLAAYRRAATDATGFVEIVPPCLVKPDAVTAVMSLDGAWQGVGSAFHHPQLGAALRAHQNLQTVALDAPMFPAATALLRVIRRVMDRSGSAASVAPHDASPLYVRNKVALTIEERRAMQRPPAVAAS